METGIVVEQQPIKKLPSPLELSLALARTAVDLGKKYPDKMTSILRQTQRFILSLSAQALSRVAYDDLSRHGFAELKEHSTSFRPYSEIIEEGVDTFRTSHPEMQVYWSRNPDGLDLKDSYQLLSSVLTKNDVGHLQNADQLVGKSLLEAVFICLQQKAHFYSIQQIVYRKLPGQLVEVLKKAESNKPEEMIQTGQAKTDTTVEEFYRIKKLVERSSAEQYDNQPVSASLLIRAFLEKNSGDLSRTLYDVAAFLKFMTRAKRAEVSDPGWIQQYILDEYSPIAPYYQLPQEEIPYKGPYADIVNKITSYLTGNKMETKIYYDVHSGNRAGEAYHVAHISALLDYLPPEGVVFITLTEYLHHGPQHGAIKALADVGVLKELPKIYNYLLSFESGAKLRTKK